MPNSPFIAPPTAARIAPTTPEEWTDEMRDAFAILEGPEGRQRGSKLNVVLTLARHPDLAKAYLAFGMHILRNSTLTERWQEIATLRTAWLFRSEYEWTKHVVRARRIGMSEEEIEAAKSGADAAVWSPLERAMLRAVDGLIGNHAIDDATWQALAAELDERQLLDFTFTVTNYAMLAMVINGVGIQLESDMPVV
jgi:alkylhydroperoxidase family enzyme